MLPEISRLWMAPRLFLLTFTVFIIPIFPYYVRENAHYFMFHIKLTATHMQAGKLGLPDLCIVCHVPRLDSLDTWTGIHTSLSDLISICMLQEPILIPPPLQNMTQYLCGSTICFFTLRSFVSSLLFL